MLCQVRRTDISDQAQRITPRAHKRTSVIHLSYSLITVSALLGYKGDVNSKGYKYSVVGKSSNKGNIIIRGCARVIS